MAAAGRDHQAPLRVRTRQWGAVGRTGTRKGPPWGFHGTGRGTPSAAGTPLRRPGHPFGGRDIRSAAARACELLPCGVFVRPAGGPSAGELRAHTPVTTQLERSKGPTILLGFPAGTGKWTLESRNPRLPAKAKNSTFQLKTAKHKTPFSNFSPSRGGSLGVGPGVSFERGARGGRAARGQAHPRTPRQERGGDVRLHICCM